MPRTVQLQKIISSTKTKPISIVVDQIATVSDHERGDATGPGSLITLVGGEEIRVIEPSVEVLRLMQ